MWIELCVCMRCGQIYVFVNIWNMIEYACVIIELDWLIWLDMYVYGMWINTCICEFMWWGLNMYDRTTKTRWTISLVGKNQIFFLSFNLVDPSIDKNIYYQWQLLNFINNIIFISEHIMCIHANLSNHIVPLE